MDPTGTVFRIERFAVHDGPGIRTTVFLKGCPLRCTWCHSPESQSARPEFMPPPDRCIACGECVAACPEHAIAGPGLPTRMDVCRRCGTCVDACPTGARVLVGTAMSVDEVVREIEKDRVFYDESRGGVTISGGEPLMQAAFVGTLVEECRARRIHVAVDTCGFGKSAALDGIRPDLFLFDIKAVDDKLHRTITRVSNRVIVDNLARVARRRAKTRPGLVSSEVVVRFPLIPGVNDAEANVNDIGRLVASLGLPRIDVLPYHRAGIAKYARLGCPYPLPEVQPPSPDHLSRIRATLAAHGLRVK